MRVSIVLPADVIVGGGPTAVSPARILALSPDGRQLAFVASGHDGQARIWIRSLDGNTARPLTGTEGAQFPFCSPDGKFVAFYVPGRPGTLRKVDVSGRAPVPICEVPLNLAGGTWNRNDVIVFSLNGGPLMRVSATGGEPEVTTVLDTAAGETRHFAPFFLPDGDRFLYLAVGSRGGGSETASGLYVGSLSSRERKLLQPVGSNAQYTQGLLVFLEGQTLMAQPFSLDRLELSGTSTVIADGVRTGGPALVRGAFTVSANGVLAYLGGVAETDTDMIWVDREGNPIAAIGERRNYRDVALAPNGRRAAMTVPDPLTGNLDIWVFDTAAAGAGTRLTFDPATDRSPVWSPDSSTIAFTSERTVPGSVYLKSASGVGAEELLVTMADTAVSPNAWSPDGATLLLSGGSPINFWRFPMSGDRKPTSWLQTPFSKGNAQFSPDGKWVAYTSSEYGRSEIHVASFTQSGSKWQVPTDGGDFPRWRGDGRELFFLARNNGALMAVPVNNSTGALEFGAPQPLFFPRARTASGYPYDVSADGQRFLVSRSVEQAAALPINIVLNLAKAVRK